MGGYDDGTFHQYCFPFMGVELNPITGEKSITHISANGNITNYVDNGTSLAPSADINAPIIRISQGQTSYLLRTNDNAFGVYGPSGLVVGKTKLSGQKVDYTYSDFSTPVSTAPRPGLLLRMTDQAGRSLNFSYDSLGNVKTLADPAGVITQYGYDEPSANCYSPGGGCLRLTSVTYPDGSVRRYHYNEAADVDPALSPVNAYLTGVTDERGIRLSEYRYDSRERVVSSGWGGHNYQLTYGGYGWAQTTVTDLLGSQRTVTYQQIINRQRPYSQSQPAGSGCMASSSNIAYDENANPVSKDDFNRTRSCFAYDLSRNLETAKVEGLGQSTDCSTVTVANATLPAGSRKVSSQWHPDWRLAIKVAEPGRITTSVYNGQPDPFNGNAIASCAPATALLPDGKRIAVLCKQVQQATTDADGHLGFSAALQSGVPNRQIAWTYNSFGQVLTEDGPRTDVADITTYVYYPDTAFTGVDPNAVGHTLGDLKQVSNAAGKLTQFTKYNKHGQLLESLDPNGVLTVNTYDLRQRLLSTSVAGQKTSYTYDAVGQLKKLTLPDLSWIGYDYDDAHRQVAVYDNNGNRTDYVLDNAGNKTAENTKNNAGALKRQLSRSIDALGRVQQTTGRE